MNRAVFDRRLGGLGRLLLLGAGALLAACEAEGPSAAADASAAAADAAPWQPAPRKPPANKLYVFDTVTFARVQPDGTAQGFDLDGKVSGKDDDTTCNKADFTSPEGTPGIDNVFATLVPLLEKTDLAAFEKLLQASIESGGVLLMVQLDGLDDWQDDPQVQVRVRAGTGLPLLGTDGKLLTGQTFAVSKRDPQVLAGQVAVQGGWIEAGPFDIDLPVEVFGKDYTLEMRKARLRLHILDSQRLDGGLIGGGITLSSVQAIAKTASEDQGNIDDIVQALTATIGDLDPGPDGVCRQMSAALSFQGVSAFFYPAK